MTMEKRTIYIHREKDEALEQRTNDEYRFVTFVNGTHDIIEIIKELIKTQYQP